MKIICVENNYSPEFKGDWPILYLKPETALTRSDWPFFVPDWSQQVECSTHLVVRINHLGKSIPERFAHRYYDEVTLGLMFTARDIQNQLKEKGLPWEISTGFDFHTNLTALYTVSYPLASSFTRKWLLLCSGTSNLKRVRIVPFP